MLLFFWKKFGDKRKQTTVVPQDFTMVGFFLQKLNVNCFLLPCLSLKKYNFGKLTQLLNKVIILYFMR